MGFNSFFAGFIGFLNNIFFVKPKLDYLSGHWVDRFNRGSGSKFQNTGQYSEVCPT